MQDGDKNSNKFDLAKVMTRPDAKGIQAHPQIRALGQSMRVVTIPPSSSGTQIIQTQLMSSGVPTMIKQVNDGRISVSRPLTPTSYHVQRGATVASIQTPRGATPLRTPTPPASVTNITPTFVRTSASPRAPSSSSTATLLPQGTNWITSTGPVVQVPTQLIRANITQSPRPRVVTQTIPQNSSSNTITANVVTQQTVQQGATGQVHGGNVITGSGNQTIGGQPAFVATLSLPPRQSGAALVYSSVSNANQTPTYNPSTQRLAVATSIGAQRQVRPINRLPTNIGVRVSTANLNIRQNIPVLTTIPSQAQTRATTTTTNLTQIPARIIQPGGTQVLSARSVQANVMTLQPIFVNNRIQQTVKTQIPQALTIAHVGKIATPASTSSNSAATITVTNLPPGQNQQASNMGGQQLTASLVSSTVLNQGQIQTQKSPQIAHILSVNQQNVQPQQHQIIQQSTGTGNSATCGKSIPLVTVSVGSVVQANVIRGIMANSSRDPPVAKVLPNRQQTATAILESQVMQQQQSSQGGGTSVFIHTTPPNVSQSTAATTVTTAALPSNAFISHPSAKFIFDHHMPASSTTAVGGGGSATQQGSFIDSMFSVSKTTVSKGSAVTSTVAPISTPNETSNAASVISSAVSYAPSAGSFAVVPSANRNVGQIHVSTSSINPNSQIQAVPVRFNPQLIVDSNQSHSGTQIIAMSSSSQLANIQPASSSTAVQLAQSTTGGGAVVQSSSQGGATHIMIPASVTKVESPRPLTLAGVGVGASNAAGSVNSAAVAAAMTASILRKRDSTGSPVKVSSTVMGHGGSTSTAQLLQQKMDAIERGVALSPHSRRASTEGSTTVSVTSSPTLDQQEREEREFSGSRMNDYFINAVPTTSARSAMTGPAGIAGIVQHQNSTSSSSNGIEQTARKRAKRNLMPNENVNTANVSSGQTQNQTSNNKVVNNHVKPEVTVKKPQSVSLLQSYKQSWKPANNHFQRHSDVRPRDDRRPNIMDLANQPHVAQKINGWKVYHLSSQIEELGEMESQVYNKLASQLESLDAHDSTPELDRVCELLKANMQREKVMIDGISDSKSHLLKVFDHKSNVEDIIQRCASKRNFKKREKP